MRGISSTGTKFARMCIAGSRIIGSKMSFRSEAEDRRENFNVLVNVEVDRNINRPNLPPEFVPQTYYGAVEYYFLHEFRGVRSMLAYIQWAKASTVQESRLGYKFFTHFDQRMEFQEAYSIDRNVGFWKRENPIKYIILDREWALKFGNDDED